MVSCVKRSQFSSLAMLGKEEIDAIKNRPVRQSEFRKLHTAPLCAESKSVSGISKKKESLRMVSQAIMEGNLSHPHATAETSRLLANATDLTTISALPSSNVERVWMEYHSFCTRQGLDPWLASGDDICIFLVDLAKETSSLTAVKGDLKSVINIRKHSKSEVVNMQHPDLLVRGLLQSMEKEEFR